MSGCERKRIDTPDISGYVDGQIVGRCAESVEMKHITKGAVSQGRRKDGDLVFVGPVKDRVSMLRMSPYLLTETSNDGTRAPYEGFIIMSMRFLLCKHSVQDWDNPVFKSAVVVVGDHEIADTIHASLSHGGARSGE